MNILAPSRLIIFSDSPFMLLSQFPVTLTSSTPSGMSSVSFHPSPVWIIISTCIVISSAFFTPWGWLWVSPIMRIFTSLLPPRFRGAPLVKQAHLPCGLWHFFRRQKAVQRFSLFQEHRRAGRIRNRFRLFPQKRFFPLSRPLQQF